ncbi:MAG: DUF4105 domain-containing protein [Gammaproteobacteria bacterium]|nr:DUF4105 domain-containing protein [Gammaproteobacteria bacterium]
MLGHCYRSFFYTGILSICLSHAFAQADFVVSDSHDTLSSSPKQQATQLNLANDPVWHKLLFFRQHAEVITPKFYLSDLTAKHLNSITPQQELDATLDAFEHDPKLICQYPARYYWLSGKLTGLPRDLLATCKNLPSVNQDVRFLLVSGYLKNPVSSFGHVLITIGDEGEKQNLLDSAYNYGAVIPPEQNSVEYVIKGFLGRYPAGFANTKFFKQDTMYAKNEQRDMWVYTLNLTDEQRALLIYHLAEMKSHFLDYYFIKQNCAYRTGELLELISDIDITHRVTPWYSPEYVFHQLEEYRKTHPDFIKNVEYLPSDQKQLYVTFSKMSQPLQQGINQYIRTGDLSLINALTAEDQTQALDFLIAYLNFKQTENKNENAAAQYEAQKKQLIRLRFQLPVSDEDQVLIPPRASPALGEKPSKVDIGVGRDQGYLGFTLYDKNLLTADSSGHDEFKMLDFSWIYRQHKLELQSADFIHILKIEDITQPLAGERKFSWSFNLGAKQDLFTGELHRPYAQGGWGVGYDFSSNLTGYGVLGAELNDSHAMVDAVGEMGLVYQRERLGFTLKEYVQERYRQGLAHDTRFEFKYRMTKNTDLRLLLSRQNNALMYQYFW